MCQLLHLVPARLGSSERLRRSQLGTFPHRQDVEAWCPKLYVSSAIQFLVFCASNTSLQFIAGTIVGLLSACAHLCPCLMSWRSPWPRSTRTSLTTLPGTIDLSFCQVSKRCSLIRSSLCWTMVISFYSADWTYCQPFAYCRIWIGAKCLLYGAWWSKLLAISSLVGQSR